MQKEDTPYGKEKLAIRRICLNALITRDCVGGGCGIRTHVRLLSNGFQDRLVMTTSITLHKSDAYSAYIFLLSYFTILMRACQEVFQNGVFFSWAKREESKKQREAFMPLAVLCTHYCALLSLVLSLLLLFSVLFWLFAKPTKGLVPLAAIASCCACAFALLTLLTT